MSIAQQKFFNSAVLYAPLVGLSAAALYQTSLLLMAEPVAVEQADDEDEKQKRIQAVFDALKDDLSENFPNGAEYDPATKLLTKDFLLKFLLLKQQYKRLVNDVIPEANGEQRIKLLRKKTQYEEALQDADEEEAKEGKKKIEAAQRKYDLIIMTEKKELDQAEVDIQEIMMDHFNLITQQYRLSTEACAQDTDFQKKLVEGREKIDKEYDDEELKSMEVPQKLTRQMSMALLKQKEQSVNECVEAYRRQVTQRGYTANDASLLEASVIAAKARFDDQMYLQQGITGKQLMAAIMQNGVYEERMNEAKKVEEEQRARQEEMMKQFVRYREQMAQKKSEEAKQGGAKADDKKKEVDDSNVTQATGWGSVPSMSKQGSIML